MADRTPPPKRDFSWGKISKTLSLWIIVILIPIVFMQVNGARDQMTEIDYSTYSQQLDLDNVQKISIQEGKVINGDFRHKVPSAAAAKDVLHFSVHLPMANDPKEIERLRAKNVEISATDAKPSVVGQLLTFLPFFLVLGIFIFIFRQMQAGGAKAFSFGKSKAKLLTGDTPKVTFADVAGADEAKEELEEIIEFLRDPQKYTRLGGRLPKGVLLVGPPGTGKTLLARAVAGEAGRPFFSMSGSDFVEMFVGVGASRVRDLFEQGKAHAPCIIFIDEIDAVGRHRGAGLGGGHDEREQTLNQLLVEMDGFESNEGVILIAATNRPDVLDPALLRPGRFDRQVVVDLPDLRGREEILRVHLRKVPVADDVEVTVIARGTPGMSGADLANLVNEAALLAARRNADKVYLADLEEAKDKVMLGAERKSMVMKDDEKRNTAYHEAGHAVCAIKTPGCDPLHKVTIVPRGRALGLAFTLPVEDRYSITRQQLEAMLVMTYGGRVAEELVFGHDKVTTGASNDIQKATSLARRYVSQWGLSDAIGPVLVGDNEQEVFLGRELSRHREVSERTAQLVDAEVTRLLNESYGRAKQTLIDNRDLLERMAEALLERETLTADDAALLVQGNPLPPRKTGVPPVVPASVAPGVVVQPKPARPGLLGGPEVAPA
ncbi:MAG: ATP-dependent metallopeptidase FtsH/Yme1/Tma family protein [Gemmatimonadaceae bacterium]|nr:ATP-dependent metallopeptidase FtsH/Yme1/Tma family protein [Gemmatimonadaceae bacterium]